MRPSKLAPVPAVGTVLVDRYELLEEIGRGGCAIVFEAADRRLGRVVAVKLPYNVTLDSVRMSRFARESRIVARIHHPNVCAVLDTGTTEEGTPFLVMERLFGASLRATVARFGRLPVGDAIAVGIQVLSALDAVHETGIVHRDVKPDNIVIVPRVGYEPLVKLLDFGLCRRAGSRRRGEEETMTCDGALVGTPEYMAPEQVLGSVTIDVRVDLYALGVVLHECLTGGRTFLARNVREILTGVISKRVPPLRELRPEAPAALEAVIARAMHREPRRRYQSASAFQADLHAVRAEMNLLPVEASEAPTQPFRRFVRPPPPPPSHATH